MSGTLWGEPGALSGQLDAYTASDDRAWDRRLLRWDIVGTAAHVLGLERIGLLETAEASRLRRTLAAALAEEAVGRLAVTDADEDVHTALERYLVERLGELGEKVHAGRSRNDQVLTDLRLYLKDRLLLVVEETCGVAAELLRLGRRHRRVLMPGYTHMRRAMPSTVGLWAAGHAASLLESLTLVWTALELVDRSPLGSAAGYGVPLSLDRAFVARALGFTAVQEVVTSVQASRGKEAAAVLTALWAIGNDLARLSWDVILFAAEEYGFLTLPAELATGSSIMPQKRNPDVFELTRGRAGLLEGYVTQAMAVAGRLPSGYHRDLQLLKEPLMRGVETAMGMLAMMRTAVPSLGVDRRACARAVREDLLATDEVFRRVHGGTPFRKAYREVAALVKRGEKLPAVPLGEVLAPRSSPGGAGDPGLARLAREIRRRREAAARRRRGFEKALACLMEA
jgi:argininosuccinate lyase